LEKVKQTSNGIEALCPSHNDKSPSLTASYTKERILFKCQAGCSFESVVSALGMEESQFFVQEEKIQPKTIESTYRYEDKDGNHVMDVVRFKPKDFRPRRPDGKYSLEGIERVPYRLPKMLEAIEDERAVLLVEGEKDCDNLAKLGLTATTFSGGAGKWRPEYLQYFKGASVCCMPDNDNSGREGMNLLASKISPVTSSIRWLNIPGIPEKGDISDWIKI
jgi:DNA primase